MRLVCISHPVGDGIKERKDNAERAARWARWAKDQGVHPAISWVTFASALDMGLPEREVLAVDEGLIQHCDEVWLCGPRVSPLMNAVADYAKKLGKPVHVLVSEAYADGPPSRSTTFAELTEFAATSLGSKVIAHARKMAEHYGVPYETFTTLSNLQLVALDMYKHYRTSEASEVKTVDKGAVP